MTPPGLGTAEAMLPLAATVVFLLSTMAFFGARRATHGRPPTPIEARRVTPAWRWATEWWVWVWGPVERACVGLGISPSAITLASAAVCAIAGGLLAFGHLSLGGWTYLLAASLDLVDGRVARAQGTASMAGAFLDSTLDRVAELAVFAGLAVHFRATPALYATLAASGASLLVSYARARGEALGAHAEARVGGMQRAERVVLTGLPCALAPLFDAGFGAGAGGLVVGSALTLLAIVTAVTAGTRAHAIWEALRRREREARSASNVRWLPLARTRGRGGP